MDKNTSDYVFLADCADFAEAQVIRSFLTSQGFHPRLRDEQTRGVAPHFGQLLGKLSLEIPEHEYIEASLLLESREKQEIATGIPPEAAITPSLDTEALAKKALWNAIIGCVFLPILCNLYSMMLGYRVLRTEIPLGKLSRNRLLWAILFNSFAFYIWLAILPAYFVH